MIWQHTPYTIPLIVATAFSIILGIYMWIRRPTSGGRIGALIILSSSEWMLTYALELASTDLPTMVFWNKMQYVGSTIVPTAWAVFAVYYTGRERWLKRRSLLLLSIIPVVTLGLTFTNEAHGLIWSNNILNTDTPFSILINTHGSWYWVYMAYSYSLLTFGISLLLIRTFTFPHYPYHQQASVLLLGALAPGVVNVLYVFDLNPFQYLNLTPLSLIVTNVAVAFAIFYLGLGSVVPMARETVVETMGDSVIVLDTTDHIVDLNSSARHLLGDAASKSIGKSIEEVWPKGVNQMKLVDDRDKHKEIVLGQGDKQCIYDINISPLTDWGGRTISRVVVLRDITERKRAEEKIKTSLQEKEVLLREVHHRVKNNMQIISSLLSLQSGYIKDKTQTEMIKESQNRIKSMALIHEKLYQSENLTDIDFNEYIEALVRGLVRSYGVNAARIAVKIEVEDISVGIDAAIPCGLIINELVSNALKHAFPNSRKGEIIVVFRSANEHIELRVIDNGVGIPEDIDFETTNSLGLHLVAILAEDQLEGEITLDRSKGAAFHIRFKEQRRKNL